MYFMLCFPENHFYYVKITLVLKLFSFHKNRLDCTSLCLIAVMLNHSQDNIVLYKISHTFKLDASFYITMYVKIFLNPILYS